MSETKKRTRGSLVSRLLEGVFVGIGIGLGVILMQASVYVGTYLLLN